jgi:REP element-mobilizing transposase RayT
MAPWVWNLRSRRSYAIIHAAVRELRERRDLRVVDYSVQGNHLHLIVEAEGPPALASGMRALSIRLARRLNAMMGRRGPVLEDRYHAHVLRTPAEVRNALRYVLGNFRSHAERRGEEVPAAWVDRYSSAVLPEGLHAQGELWREPITRPARTWLLRTAARRAGRRAR